MGLLDKLEKKIAKHPLADETYETKINYLNALAFFIVIDDKITEHEKDSFNKIIELLDCEDAKDDLYDFMENPDLDEFENIFKFIDEKDYFITYILEVFYLLEHKTLNDFESRFIDMIIDIFKYTKDELDIIFEFVNNISNEDEIIASMKKIVTCKKLFDKSKDFYSFYKLSHKTKDTLVNEYKKYNEIIELELELESIEKVTTKPVAFVIHSTFTRNLNKEYTEEREKQEKRKKEIQNQIAKLKG